MGVRLRDQISLSKVEPWGWVAPSSEAAAHWGDRKLTDKEDQAIIDKVLRQRPGAGC